MVAPALERQGPLTGRDWTFLLVSVIFLIGGAGLAHRFAWAALTILMAFTETTVHLGMGP